MRREVQRKIQPILARYKAKIADAIRKGEATEGMLQQLFDELQAALKPELAKITTARLMDTLDEVGVGFDLAVISEEALQWAGDYSYYLVSDLNNTTQKLVSRATQTFIETPGMTRGDLEALLEPAFGARRAEMIAVTEVTRAYSEATNMQQTALAQDGIQMRRVWQTLNDDLVCPICGPLNGQPEEDWSIAHPDGPPAHVNCRCSTSLTVADVEEVRAEAGELAAQREKLLEELGT